MAEALLRSALETDFSAIKALIHEAGINPTGLDWHRFIVVEFPAGRFAGCGQLKPHAGGIIEMASIVVSPSARGQGLARLIIQKLITDAPRPLYLTCRSQMGKFYEKFGFRPISGNDLPKYFQRLSRLVRLINTLHIMEDRLLVMVLD